MMMALGGAALRLAAPAIANAAGGFFQGKVGETVGGHNEQQSESDRARARSMNEGADTAGDRQANSSNRAANDQQGRSRAELILVNQLDASNKRADLQNTMAANDQILEYNRGQNLANNYVQASRDQATASGNIYNSIMNRQATQYGTVGISR
jgi:hypothetical protein